MDETTRLQLIECYTRYLEAEGKLAAVRAGQRGPWPQYAPLCVVADYQPAKDAAEAAGAELHASFGEPGVDFTVYFHNNWACKGHPSGEVRTF